MSGEQIDSYCLGCSRYLGELRDAEYCEACERSVRPESVCEHGALRRVCMICELQVEIARLTRERDEAREEVERLRRIVDGMADPG